MKRTSLASLVVLPLIALSACSTPAVAPVSQPPAAGSPSVGGAASGVPSVDASSAAAAGIDPANPPKPVASSTVPTTVQGKAATIKVDIFPFKRSGKLLIGTFAFTPGGSTSGTGHLMSWLGGSYFAPYLVDSTNLKLYGVVKSNGQSLLTQSVLGPTMASGTTIYAYAVFAAPPAEVSAVDVEVSENLPVFRSVPLS